LADADQGHVIVPFWSAHQLSIALLTEERFGLAALRRRFEVVADDSFGGEMMRQVGERFGLRMRPIHSRGNPERFNDVADWLRRPEPFLIAVDGASRYGTIPTGIVRLASRTKSTLWPLAVRSRAFVRIPGFVAEVPLPYAPIALGVAPPLKVEPGASVAAIADELRRRLNDATDAATAALRRSMPQSLLI
jgi:lysophospholipid acyltransferase (LPLAT)-like uncharacterized protein